MRLPLARGRKIVSTQEVDESLIHYTDSFYFAAKIRLPPFDMLRTGFDKLRANGF
jgi:hypothetical protein